MRHSWMLTVLMILSCRTALPAEAPTFHDCELREHFGRIVHVVYCPKAINPRQIAELFVATKGIWLQRYGFVQYHVFSTLQGLPKSMNELLAKSDEWFEKNELAMATFNSATRHQDFACRRPVTAELADCTQLLK